MIISVERMVLSTPCLMLCYGFQGRQIEWRYFQFDQEPSVVAFCQITSVLVLSRDSVKLGGVRRQSPYGRYGAYFYVGYSLVTCVRRLLGAR